MYQATTPTITIDFGTTSPDLTQLGECLVSLVQGKTVIESEPTVETHKVTLELTQAQTQKLEVGSISVQVNFTKDSGDRVCSNVLTTNVDVNLHNEVIVNDNA